MTAAGLGTAAAVVLALVFVFAAGSKARDRVGTRRSFADLGVPAPRTAAVVVPILEVATAVALLVRPAIGGVVALVVLAFFTTFLAGRLRAGITSPCSCFGGTGSHPLSVVELLRNAELALLAVAALAAPHPERPTVADLVALAAMVAAGAAGLALVRRRGHGTVSSSDGRAARSPDDGDTP